MYFYEKMYAYYREKLIQFYEEISLFSPEISTSKKKGMKNGRRIVIYILFKHR